MSWETWRLHERMVTMGRPQRCASTSERPYLGEARGKGGEGEVREGWRGEGRGGAGVGSRLVGRSGDVRVSLAQHARDLVVGRVPGVVDTARVRLLVLPHER